MKEKGLFPEAASETRERSPSRALGLRGAYTDGERAVRFLFDRRSDAEYPPSASRASAGEAPPPVSLVYSDGVFHNYEKGTSYYFASEGKNVYLIMEKIPGFGMNVPAFQRLEEIKEPKSLSIEMNGVLWMVRNMLPGAQIMNGTLMGWSSTSHDLPDVSVSLQKVEDFSFASIASTASATSSYQLPEGRQIRQGRIFVLSPADEAESRRRKTA